MPRNHTIRKGLIILVLSLIIVSQAQAASPVTGSLTATPAAIKSGSVTDITYSLANTNGQQYTVYVENAGNAVNILKQDTATDGTFHTSWNGKYSNGTNVPDGTYTIKLNTTPYWTTMGNRGTEPGQFDSPDGITVDDTGNIYVADTENHRIQVWNKATNTWTTMGNRGTELGQFNWPHGITVDNTGNIYVADTYNHRIQVWNKATNTWTTTGSSGTEPGQFNAPYSIVVDDTGNIYVTDTANRRIQVWNKATNTWTTTGSSGTEPGQFNSPHDIVVDDTGNIYVTDTGNCRIQVWNKATNTWTTTGSYGSGPGQFYFPHGIAVDDTGNVYVADSGNHRIQVWNKATNTWTTTGSIGYEAGQFNGPFGIAVDDTGNVYVADTGNLRIQVWNAVCVDAGSDVFVDNTVPTVTCTPGGIPVNGWYDASVPVTLSATDNGGSGIGSFEYSLDNVNWNSNNPFTVNAEGTNTVYWNCTDKMGNSALGSQSFKIDMTNPETVASLIGTQVNGVYTSDVTVTLSATDSHSDVDYTEYRVNNGNWIRYTGPFTISGSSSITYRSMDNAGNLETANTVSFSRIYLPPGTISMDEIYGRQPTATPTPTVTPIITPVPAENTTTATTQPTTSPSEAPTPPTATASSTQAAEPPQGIGGYWLWIALIGIAIIVVVGSAYYLFLRK